MSLYPFVDFSYKWTMQCLTSCIWLTSLCMIFSRSANVAATAHFMHFWAEEYAIVYMYNNFCVHTSVYEHHTCLRGWAVVYSAAVKKEWTSVCVCVCSTTIFCRYLPRDEVVWLLYFLDFGKLPTSYPYWL